MITKKTIDDVVERSAFATLLKKGSSHPLKITAVEFMDASEPEIRYQIVDEHNKYKDSANPAYEILPLKDVIKITANQPYYPGYIAKLKKQQAQQQEHM